MKPKIAFVFGGMSVEHEISIITGLQAYHAFKSDKYDAYPLYLSKENKFYYGDNLSEIENYRNLDSVIKNAQEVILVKGERGQNKLVSYPQRRFGKNIEVAIDMAFLCVHGTNVEDGALQGFFHTLGVPICGCDVESAALGMDKYVQKAVLEQANIPVLPAKRFTHADYENLETIVDDVEKTFNFPVIVKPTNLGSSVGISVATNRDDLVISLDNAYQYSDLVLVERAVENLREINCSVLGDIEQAQASEIEEPLSSDEILSYEDKYMNGNKGSSKGMASVSRKIPAEVSLDLREKIRDLSIKAFQALGCSGVARIDFLLDSQTDEIFFNEINTIPGSLSFYLWEPCGVSYAELLNKIVEISEKRDVRQRALTFSFDTNVLDSASLSGAKGK